MDSTPRRWVLRPLSPSLQPSDLRSISAQQEDDVFYPNIISAVGSQSSLYVKGGSESSEDVMVTARQMSVSQDGDSSSDELPISPCSSSAGSHSGFYSFVEDPFSSEAEQNEAWMVSPQRQSQLATLRQENAYKLQTYSSHRKPGSLFQDDTDSQYEITPRYGYKVVGKQEERQLRMEIIRGQAPKKSPVAEKELDSLTSDTNRLIEGFSISFSHVSAKPTPTVDSDAINKEQINFNDARKQFVQMEQNKLDPIIRPRKIKVNTSPKLKQDATVLDKEVRKEELMFEPNMEDFKAEEKDDQSTSRSRQNSYLGDSDGLSLNVSYSSIDGLAHKPIQMVNNTFQFSVEPETPIEREIRITQEREENLRRSRGLQSSVSEMVEIKTKRLQLQTPLTPSRAKDKGRASFIFQEIQRKEEAIKQDSTMPEFTGTRRVRAHSYDILQSNEGDMGQSNQEYVVTKAFETMKENMGEKAKLDVVDYALQKQNYTVHDGSKVDNGQSHTTQGQEYIEPYIPGPKQVEGYSCAKQNDQVLARNWEFEGFKSSKERWQNQNGDKMENGFKGDSIERSRVDFFSDDVLPLPCYPHKKTPNSAPSKQEQKQDSSRSHSPQTSGWRDRLEQTGLHTRGQGAAQFIERDIEEALRREQELREQREAQVRQVYSPQTLVQQADKMATMQFYPQIKTGKAESRTSSSPRPSLRLSTVPLMSPQPWSFAPQTPQTPSSNVAWTIAPQIPETPQTPQTPSHLVVRTPLPFRGLTQTLLQDFEERRGKLKLEDSAYAGIQPIDSVNNEVVESTRVVRHKNRRALQWEAGVFANQQDQ